MYEIPVITWVKKPFFLWSLPILILPTLVPFFPKTSALAIAFSIKAAPSSIASFESVTYNRLPVNRIGSILMSAATITKSAACISVSVSTFSAPIAPSVSTLTWSPRALAAFSIDSAAIYVCAIPAAQAVTATIFIGPLLLFCIISTSITTVKRFHCFCNCFHIYGYLFRNSCNS